MGRPLIPGYENLAAHAAIPVADQPEAENRPSSLLRQWRRRGGLSSVLHAAEAFLASRPFERMPWLAVAMLAGTGLWFLLPGPAEWLVLTGLCGLVAGCGWAWWQDEDTAVLRAAIMAVAVMVAAGCLLAWLRSELVGTHPIEAPVVTRLHALILEREEQPARNRVRLVVATQDPQRDRAIRARINISAVDDRPFLQEGAVINVRARLTPPTHPVLPGGYDFARIAWFDGIAATGSAIDPPVLASPAEAQASGMALYRRDLARHVRTSVASATGSDGAHAAIAATLASGDRGAINDDDALAMRDAGLAHLLSISGLHVGAVVGIVWFAMMKTLALFPALALRTRLPLVASAGGAVAAVAYTLMTGAAVPTIRACIAALLVMAALALGRQALSMRLIALAAITVMLFWPEAVVGPSFQFSFAAVIAIVALHNSAPMRALVARGEHGAAMRLARAALALLITGLVVEAALAPLVLFHFHRSGVLGALANLVAIPLTTTVIMPALGVALLLDLVGLGWPAWFVTGKALELLIGIAQFVSSIDGSILLVPAIPLWAALLFVSGFLWLALWEGRVRVWGVLPALAGLAGFAVATPPDLMVAAEGRHVAIANDEGQIFLLRNRRGFAHDQLLEEAGFDAASEQDVQAITQWPGADCNRDFCLLTHRHRVLLISRRRSDVDYATLLAACAASDVVVAERKLPEHCRPRMAKIDQPLLTRRGGVTMNLQTGVIRSARPARDRHGWM
ncbi:ComEC/Rec2 family competence protein [Croceicoccus sp. F390]|uniref:ComEC/Rec2 family competence protein n=1 Tax=Croceicoccus esteveae TaxID=3075597 RepID=A0ABU2ZIT9_9SPHN|nr:ComEC/Rec2 family competence protein [Croceicoccus sp. F390]MDT0575489.1 ComEC/Rec2 family competence protein [Croceicoccus sp. F390]